MLNVINLSLTNATLESHIGIMQSWYKCQYVLTATVFYLMCQSSFSILFNKSKVLDRIMYNQTDAFMED